MRYSFEDCVLDTDCRELRRGAALVAVEPQVFDLLVHLIRHRDRVVSKDDLLASVWQGRIVSESALFNRINAARSRDRRYRRPATADQDLCRARAFASSAVVREGERRRRGLQPAS